MPIASKPGEQKIIDDVATYGFSIMNILNSERDEADRPEFSYTIGLFEKYQHPEIILFGLRKIRSGIISSLGAAVKGGMAFKADELYDDIVGDYKCTFREVSEKRYPEYLGFATWYYDYQRFPALQCVWPDKNQIFPWQRGFDQRFAWEQELLFDQ